MNSPPSEIIEGAAENLQQGPTKEQSEYPTLTTFIFNSQLKELDGFGPGRLAELRKLELPDSDLPTDFRLGYLLGLQVARYSLAMSAALALKDVKPGDVL